jgi:hypothetical protein
MCIHSPIPEEETSLNNCHIHICRHIHICIQILTYIHVYINICINAFIRIYNYILISTKFRILKHALEGFFAVIAHKVSFARFAVQSSSGWMKEEQNG